MPCGTTIIHARECDEMEPHAVPSHRIPLWCLDAVIMIGWAPTDWRAHLVAGRLRRDGRALGFAGRCMHCSRRSRDFPELPSESLVALGSRTPYRLGRRS